MGNGKQGERGVVLLFRRKRVVEVEDQRSHVGTLLRHKCEKNRRGQSCCATVVTPPPGELKACHWVIRKTSLPSGAQLGCYQGPSTEAASAKYLGLGFEPLPPAIACVTNKHKRTKFSLCLNCKQP